MPDGEERLGGHRANNVVCLRPQRFTSVGGGGRHRYDDPAGLLLSQRLDGGPHRGSGRQTVVNQDDRPTTDIRRRAIAPIEPLASGQLL